MAKKTRAEDIDTSFIINSFREDDYSIPPHARSIEGEAEVSVESGQEKKPDIPAKKENTKEESERKKTVKSDYEDTFVRKSALTARQGKQVYIRKEFHDRILKITQVIGHNEITIADYLDNVMVHHFGQFQNDVAESFNRHIKSYNNL
ncbi:DUF3408 domain-containing protein [Bacteroides sp. 14(A)]|uniref:DUF3408 domain-containing protein n=1 Tax=Bacteroides sp. 14(A) TaxID=1163670 RepID=UPI00047853A9|nr:DUF3408 domain-containing protein [Bacteroides sp. 14(A)]